MITLATKSFTASEAKNKFGEVLESAQRSPVAILRHNRPVAFVISAEDIESIEDHYLGSRAKAIMESQQSLGTKKSMEYLIGLAHAHH